MAQKPQQSKTNVPAKREERSNVPAEATPDFMKGTGGQGTENIGSRDVEIPRLQLMQAVSEQVMSNDDIRPGMWYHSIAEKALGRNLIIVPVYVDTRAMLWRPRDTGGGILARTDDMKVWSPSNARFDVQLKKGDKKVVTWETKRSVEESRLLEWGSSNLEDPASAPAATRMINMVVMLPELESGFSPVVMTFQRASMKIGRKFLGKMKLADVAMFGHVFELSAEQEEGPSGTYYVPRLEGRGFIKSAEDFARYKSIYENFKREGVRIRDEEGLQGEEVATGGTAGASGESEDDDKKY